MWRFHSTRISTLRLKITSASDATSPHFPCPPSAPATLLQFRKVSHDEVAKALLSSSERYCDLDPVPTSLLKQCLSVLLPTITNIVNPSLSSRTFPDQFKHSVLKPLLNKSNLDRASLSSYRRISNLPFIINDWSRHNSQNTWIPTLYSTRTNVLIWSTIPQKLFYFQSMTTLFRPSAINPSQVLLAGSFCSFRYYRSYYSLGNSPALVWIPWYCSCVPYILSPFPYLFSLG